MSSNTGKRTSKDKEETELEVSLADSGRPSDNDDYICLAAAAKDRANAIEYSTLVRAAKDRANDCRMQFAWSI